MPRLQAGVSRQSREASGAGDRARTGDPLLGKRSLLQQDAPIRVRPRIGASETQLGARKRHGTDTILS
jgi:hypothetical protein